MKVIINTKLFKVLLSEYIYIVYTYNKKHHKDR